MFQGACAISVDAKHRVSMPVRYRTVLAQQCQSRVVLTIDSQFPCLQLYPEPEWQQIADKLRSLPTFDPAARRLQRLLMGHAHELVLDGQGRFLLPALLREYAAIGTEVMLVGQFHRFELWDAARWQQQIQQDIAAEREAGAGVSAELASLSL